MEVAWNHVLSSIGIGGLDSNNLQQHTDNKGARGEFRIDESGDFFTAPQEFSPRAAGADSAWGHESKEQRRAHAHTYSSSSLPQSRVGEEIFSLQTQQSVHSIHPIESDLLLWVAYRRCHEVCGELDAEYVAEELMELEGALELACQQSIQVTGSAVDEEYVGESMMVCLGGYRSLAKMLIEEHSQQDGRGDSAEVIGQDQGAAGIGLEKLGEAALVPHQKPKVVVFEASKKLTAASPFVKKLLSSQQERGVALNLQEEREIEPEWKGTLTAKDIKSMSIKEIQRLVDWRRSMVRRSEIMVSNFEVDGRRVPKVVQKMLVKKSPEEAERLIKDMEAAKYGKLISRQIDENEGEDEDDGETTYTDGTSMVTSLHKLNADPRQTKSEMMSQKPSHASKEQRAPLEMTTSNGALVHRISTAMQRLLKVCVRSEGGRMLLCMPRASVAEQMHGAGARRSGAPNARIADGETDAFSPRSGVDSARSGPHSLRSGHDSLVMGRKHIDLMQHLLEQKL